MLDAILFFLMTAATMPAVYVISTPHSGFNRNSASVATLLTRDEVSSRRSDSLEWVDVKDKYKLYRGDIVATDDKTTATIVFQNQDSILLPHNALIQIEESTPDSFHFMLVKGSLSIHRKDKVVTIAGSTGDVTVDGSKVTIEKVDQSVNITTEKTAAAVRVAPQTIVVRLDAEPMQIASTKALSKKGSKDISLLLPHLDLVEAPITQSSFVLDAPREKKAKRVVLIHPAVVKRAPAEKPAEPPIAAASSAAPPSPQPEPTEIPFDVFDGWVWSVTAGGVLGEIVAHDTFGNVGGAGSNQGYQFALELGHHFVNRWTVALTYSGFTLPFPANAGYQVSSSPLSSEATAKVVYSISPIFDIRAHVGANQLPILLTDNTGNVSLVDPWAAEVTVGTQADIPVLSPFNVTVEADAELRTPGKVNNATMAWGYGGRAAAFLAWVFPYSDKDGIRESGISRVELGGAIHYLRQDASYNTNALYLGGFLLRARGVW